MVELDKLKQLKAIEFDSIIYFIAKEISKWLITFVSVNEEYFALVVILQQEYRELEEDILNENVKHEIVILPTKDSIQPKLKEFLQETMNL